jgi:hypothetical protein
MSKLFVNLALTLALLLGLTTPADAAFLVPIVAGVVGSVILAEVIVAVGTIALSAGIQWAANKLLAPDVPAAATVGGAQLDLKADTSVPESLLLGRCVLAGSQGYAETYGQRGTIDNSDLIQVIALADHPCHGLYKVFIESTEVVFVPPVAPVNDKTYGTDADPSRGQCVDGYDGKVAVSFFDGSQTTADAFAVLALSTHPERPYTTDRVGRGRTYARIHYVYDSEKVPGVLQWRWVVDGALLYDPRLDDTVGGSGTHRWDDLDTHEFTTNLAVHCYNILRGIRVKNADGDLIHFYGLENTPAANLPLDNWFAAMNECDVDVDGEPQFHGGAEVPCNVQPLDAIKQILICCDGRLSEVGGVYKLHVGAPGLPVIEYEDGHLRADQSDEFRPILPLTSRVNYVTGDYIEPADGWIPKVAPPRGDPTMETEDGRRLPADLKANMVQSGTHFQRLQKQMLLKSRQQRRHTDNLPPEFFGLEPGDVVSKTSIINGYDTKLFEVDNVDLHANLFSTIYVTEIDPADYDWEPVTDVIAQTSSSLIQAAPAAKIIESFDAVGIRHHGDGGQERPAIQVTWQKPEDGDLTLVDIEVRRPSVPLEVLNSYGKNAEFESTLILDNIAPDTDYEVRGRFVSVNHYTTEWSSWRSCRTPDTRFLSSEFADDVQDTLAEVAPTVERAAHLLDVQTKIIKALSPTPATLPVGTDPVVAAQEAAEIAAIIPVSPFERSEVALRAAMKALQQATFLNDRLVEAGLGTHTETGRWSIEGVGVIHQGLIDLQASVGVTVNLLQDTLTLYAKTTYVNDVAAAIIQGSLPAYRWDFNNSLEGWTLSGCTSVLNEGSVTLTTTGAVSYMQSPAITLDADANKIVNIDVRRILGTDWGMELAYGSTFSIHRSILTPAVPTSFNLVGLDQNSDVTWTGTLTAVRIYFGGTTGDSFEFSSVELGNFRLQDLLLADVEARLASAQLQIDGLIGSIEAKANATTVNAVQAVVNDVILSLNAAIDQIDLAATQTVVDALDTRVSSAEIAINGALSQISQLVSTSGLVESDAANTAVLKALAEIYRLKDRVLELSARGSSEMRAYVDDLGGFVATVRVGLESRVADNVAALLTESTTRASADSAEALVRTTLAAEVHDPATGLAVTRASTLQEITDRASAVSAEAALRVALAAEVHDPVTGLAVTRASTLQEITDRATAVSAEAALRVALAAEVHDATTGNVALASSITTEASARASADSAEAALRTALASQVNDATTGLPATRASALQEISDRVTAVSAEAALRVALAAEVHDATTGNVALASSITTEASTRASADSAESALRVTLAAEVHDVTTGLPATRASVLQEITDRASADSAESALRVTLAAEVHDVTTGLPATRASVLQEITDRATAVSAEAALRVALAAEVHDATTGNVALAASISSEASTRASADTTEASARTALAAEVHDATTGNVALAASVASETSARISGDGVNASAITSVSTTVSGHTSSIGLLLTSTSGSNIFGGIVGTINGVTGGLVLTGFLRADHSVQYNVEINGNLLVSGSVTALQLAALSVTAGKVHADAIDTPNLIADAATKTDFATGTATFTYNGTDQTLLSLTVNASGFNQIVLVSVVPTSTAGYTSSDLRNFLISMGATHNGSNAGSSMNVTPVAYQVALQDSDISTLAGAATTVPLTVVGRFVGTFSVVTRVLSDPGSTTFEIHAIDFPNGVSTGLTVNFAVSIIVLEPKKST